MTVNEKDPVVVGVPAIVPVGDSVSPGGRLPVEMLNVYGPGAPDAVRVWLYGVPTLPPGSEAGEMVVAGQLMTIVKLPDPTQPLASVALTLNGKLPGVVGVPLIVPVDERVSPGGRDPEESAKVYGAVPPEALNAALYGVPTVPAGGVPPTVMTGQEMVMVNPALPGQELASVTLTVKELVPAVVGVPEMTPAELMVRPGGRVPELMLKVYGAVPPLGVKVWL